MKGGDNLKNFFGSIFLNRNELEEAGINYPIKVEYYKITDPHTILASDFLIAAVSHLNSQASVTSSYEVETRSSYAVIY